MNRWYKLSKMGWSISVLTTLHLFGYLTCRFILCSHTQTRHKHDTRTHSWPPPVGICRPPSRGLLRERSYWNWTSNLTSDQPCTRLPCAAKKISKKERLLLFQLLLRQTTDRKSLGTGNMLRLRLGRVCRLPSPRRGLQRLGRDAKENSGSWGSGW